MRILLALCLVSLFILVSASTVLADSTGYIDVTITGEELAPAVDTLVPVVGVDNVTFRGSVINSYGLDITERGFEWGDGIHGVYTASWSELPGPWGNGIFTYFKSPLLVSHTYHYRAFAKNALGTTYGPEVDFTTSVQCPTGLSAWKITNNLVGLSWTKGPGTDNTFIVRKIGSYPDNQTDGVIVYNGTDDNATDAGVDFGYLASGGYYYRAWGEQGGTYTSCYTEDFVGGGGMLILAFICLCGVLTGLSGWKRFLPLAMAASIAWLTFTILALTSPDTIGVGSLSETWVQALGFVLALMVFVPVLLYIRPTTTLSKSKDGISWTEQGGIPKDKSSRSERTQREYRQQLRAKWRK